MLRKSRYGKIDYRELLLEYNNTPMINLEASPSQILQSRTLRTQLPMISSKLEPKIQTHIYEYLGKQKDRIKQYYDKTCRKQPTILKRGKI